MNRSLRNMSIVITVLISSCGTAHRVTSSWMDPEARSSQKKYTTIFIAVLTQNQSAKNIVEDDLSKAAVARGYKTLKSSEIFPPNFTKAHADSSIILAKARELGCDVILTSALINKEDASHYEPGSVSYAPYMGYRGRRFGGYYGYAYPVVYGTPGYYTEEKKYFIETNLFDAGTEKMIYSVQSTAYDPSTIAAFSRDYCNAVTKQFTKDLHAR